jgi:hypothetical protein
MPTSCEVKAVKAPVWVQQSLPVGPIARRPTARLGSLRWTARSSQARSTRLPDLRAFHREAAVMICMSLLLSCGLAVVSVREENG